MCFCAPHFRQPPWNGSAAVPVEDVEDGTIFNDLSLGNAVSFELFEDAVSGARALRVARRTRSR
jgi:hypothetical protein